MEFAALDFIGAHSRLPGRDLANFAPGYLPFLSFMQPLWLPGNLQIRSDKRRFDGNLAVAAM
jgi:hypothetical protein